MRWVVVLITLATLAASLAGAGASARSTAAHVVVLDRSPIVVRGTRFVPSESVTVRVIVRGGPRATKTVRAGVGGTWTARFRGMSLGDCDSFFVRAVGVLGSRAAYTEYPAPCGAAP